MTPALSPQQVQERVGRAITTLTIKDRDLLDINVNERSISHQLAGYLQQEFPGWNVDCEYNRDGSDKKTLLILRNPFRYDDVKDDDLEAKTVYPDIIIHHRQTDENLLVIEMKKSGGDTSKDIAKLEAFTGAQYEYRFGLLLVVGGDGLPTKRWFRKGKEDEVGKEITAQNDLPPSAKNNSDHFAVPLAGPR